MHNEPFHIFKNNVFTLAHNACPKITMEWLEATQSDRLNLYWNCNESSVTAGETISNFAKGYFSKTYMKEGKTPKQLALSYTVVN